MSASSFRFGAINYQVLVIFYAKIPMPNSTHLKSEIHIVPINVPFLIVLGIFMQHGMQMDFNNHQLTSKQEKCKIPLHYLRGHVDVRPKMNTKACRFTDKQLKSVHYHFMIGKRFFFTENSTPPDQFTKKLNESYIPYQMLVG